jgi:hypothetical protein
MSTATTRLNKPWLLKTLISAVVLVGFGLYGLYDATVAYPARGMRFASFQQYQYLEAAKANNQLDSRAVENRLSVADPVGELARIRALDRGRYTPLDAPRRDWLEALETVGKLSSDQTKIGDATVLHAELTKEWTRADGGSVAAPKPLSWYDIPVQWVFVAIGFGVGGYLFLLFANVARQKYHWEEPTQTLHLPDANTLTPADIEDFDKRKWDKYLIFLKIKPTHATLGGRELKLDLYRYTPLEEWVLAMEKTAFPERAEESDSGHCRL